MTKLDRFLDDDRKGRWANLRMDNGDPCWVGIAQAGVLVKKSKIGLFGAKLYEEKNTCKAASTALVLNNLYPRDLTPAEILNPVLKSIVNAILHCNNLDEVTKTLNEPDAETPDSFRQGIMDIANRINKDNEFPVTSDFEDAAATVLVHIISSIHTKMGVLPVEGQIKETDAVASVIFLHLVGTKITSFLNAENAETSLSNITISASKVVFQLLDSKSRVTLIMKGVEEHNKIIESSNTMENVENYTDNIGLLTYAYGKSQDDQMLEVFSKLRSTLVEVME